MFKTASSLSRSIQAQATSTSSWHRRFTAGLFACVLLLFCVTKPQKAGDFAEYGIMTIAFASHATPDIRLSDIEKAKRLNPEPALTGFYQGLEDGVRAHAKDPAIAFVQGRDGRYYALHFFAYSAIAALPFAAFEALGIPPYKCYQFVNLAFIYVLGIAALRFFGSARRAAAATGLFFLCGGALYWNWSSAETMTAASLLAGLMLYLAEAPLAAGLLVGLASMQNPPAVMFAAFAPLLHLLHLRSQGHAWRASWKAATRPARFAALAVVALLFSLPILFSLSRFGVPSLLAAVSTSPLLISRIRLFSMFFDLNQGMLIGVPALLAALAWLIGFAKTAVARLLACTALLFSIAMAIPALSTHNWNSGATGIMRYGFWASMPFLFVCLLHARQQTVPKALVAILFIVQTGATLLDRSYSHVEFSGPARFALRHFPSAYNPVFEIFAERLMNRENAVSKDQVLYYKDADRTTKIAFNLAHRRNASREICGPNRRLDLDAGVTVVDDGWAYLNAQPVCAPQLTATLEFAARDFDDPARLRWTGGWGGTEFGGAEWDGRWTVAPDAQVELRLPADLPYTGLTLCGHYMAAGMQTEVAVNGHVLGSYALDRCPLILVPAAVQGKHGISALTLRHAASQIGAQTPGDSRRLGFFLTKITVE